MASVENSDRKTILIVDDEKDLLGLLCQALEIRGFQVLAASTAEAALFIAKNYERPINLLLSDVTLAGVSGLDLAGQIADLHPGAATLFISGEPTPPARSPRFNFLAKPFTIEELLQRIRMILT
jgi:DNA-binding response OmpR family regulator